MKRRQNTKYRSVIKTAHSVRSFFQQIASKLGISISKLNLKSLLAKGLQGRVATDGPDVPSVEQIPHDPKSNYVEPVVIIPFSTSLGSANTRANVAVVFHAFNVDQAADFLKYFQNIPIPFSLFISTDTAQKATKLRKVFDKGPADRTEVRVLPNRGRDIAPKLLGFADVHRKHDLVLHLHTKVSSHDANLLGWRDFILDSLLGSREAVRSILEAFDHSPQLGMIAPRHVSKLRPNMNWGVNFDGAAKLANRMGLTLFPDSPVDFPSGSMFWARSTALQPLFDANLTLEDFPEEASQTDGTIAHSIERLFFYSSELAGLRWMRVARTEKLIAPEQPLYIHSKVNLDWAMSDQMPSLLLPGVRPRPTQINGAPDSIEQAKDRFRSQCDADLTEFLQNDESLAFDPAGNPRVSVVIVLFNQAELTFHCLQSLKQHADSNVEIIITDNGSTDRTHELLERLDNVKITKNRENLHFLRAVNKAVEDAQGEYVLLLKNDVRVERGAIEAAVERLDHEPDLGAVGGPIVLVDGSLQEAGSIIFSDGSCLGYGRGRDPGEVEFQFQRDVDYCSGAFLMLRRKLWKELGAFDEVFAPAYYEETDLCMRIRGQGHRVGYEPKARITHFEFGSAGSIQAAIELQSQNRAKFVARHAEALRMAHALPDTPPVIARQQRENTPRLLIIDDRVPFPSLGAGYPRAAAMMQNIAASGWALTLFPIVAPCTSTEEAYTVLPRSVELTAGLFQISLPDFLRSRIGCYDAVFVSRPYNMEKYLEAIVEVPQFSVDMPLLYDAEAIFSERDGKLAQLRGHSMRHLTAAVEKEVALAKTAQIVFSVNENEAEKFRLLEQPVVRVLGHAVVPKPVNNEIEGRRDILFVGALEDKESPNTDSLFWFVENVMPLIDSNIGTDWTLNVAGRAGPAVRAIETPRVKILGRVADLDPLYASARVFIAPTRYAAGIPMKVHEAAGKGVPVVATQLLTDQLGWKNNQELLSADTPEDFADACVRLWEDDDLWSQLRKLALKAVHADCSPDKFRATIVEALDSIRPHH